MTKDNIIYDSAKDKNVANYLIFGEADERKPGKYYTFYDQECTDPVKDEDMVDMYKKGRILIYANSRIHDAIAMDLRGHIFAIDIDELDGNALSAMKFHPGTERPEPNNNN